MKKKSITTKVSKCFKKQTETYLKSGYISVKVPLVEKLREERISQGLSQRNFADAIGSSQSRIAKMESNDDSVSIDLVIKALLALGLTAKQIGSLIARNN